MKIDKCCCSDDSAAHGMSVEEGDFLSGKSTYHVVCLLCKKSTDKFDNRNVSIENWNEDVAAKEKG